MKDIIYLKKISLQVMCMISCMIFSHCSYDENSINNLVDIKKESEKQEIIESTFIAHYSVSSEDANIVYESNSEGTIHYVNGNPIDLSYDYEESVSNSAGNQSYHIRIDTNKDIYAILDEQMYRPTIVHYYFSTSPALVVDERAVLMLTFGSDDEFYHIQSVCSGAYAENTLWTSFNEVTVFIDPDTGRLIDILTYNYYYDFVTQGTQEIKWSRRYNDIIYQGFGD